MARVSVRRLDPRNLPAGMLQVRSLREVESWMAWVRMFAVLFALLKLNLFTHGYPPGHERWAWLTTAALALGAALFFALTRQERDRRAQIGLGVLALAFDTAIASALLFVFAFEPGTPMNQVFVLVVIEAAIRFGLAGAIALVIAGVPILALVEVWHSSRFGSEAYNADHVALPLMVMMLVGLLVGWLVERLSGRADALRRLLAIEQAVLEANQDGIIFTDTEDRPLIRNAAARRMRAEHGLSDVTSAAEFFHAVGPRTTDPERFAALAEVIAADPEHEGRIEYELAASGRRYTRFTTPVRDPAGGLIGRLFVVRDVTAERAADRTKSELLDTVSHELRTPLTAILGFAELLTGTGRSEETVREYAQTIEAEARRLARLVDHVIDLQKFEPGSLARDGEPVDLCALLQEVVERTDGELPDRTLTLAVPEQPLLVRGDRERLRQVISALVSNALQYSPPSAPVAITSLEPAPGVVRTTVCDGGIGIPSELHAKVFEPFFRADSTDTRANYGLGLGLALARQLIVAHGGDMGFESRNGEGSTFWFELPTHA